MKEKIKSILEGQKKILEEQIHELEKVPEFGSDVAHSEEESDEAEEFGNQLSVSAELRERLLNVNVALRKMESGKYGICETCGKEIEPEVLEVEPASRLCMACKLVAGR